MSSLHARRPPRLEQGEHLRKTRRKAGITPKRGAGSLRRPPSASISAKRETQVGNCGGGGKNSPGSKKKCCSIQRTFACTFVAVVVVFLFMQMKGMFGLMLSTSDGSNLRGAPTLESEANPNSAP